MQREAADLSGGEEEEALAAGEAVLPLAVVAGAAVGRPEHAAPVLVAVADAAGVDGAVGVHPAALPRHGAPAPAPAARAPRGRRARRFQ